jgi:hypothetical protein
LEKEFIKQNDLVLDTSAATLPSDAPSWFKPKENYKVWVPPEINQGSTYYEDSLSRHMFIYEIQL